MNSALNNLFCYSYRKCKTRPKLRGVLRKAKNILKSSEQYSFEIKPSYWFNSSHVHLDWKSIGNLGPKIRLMMIEAHCHVYRAQAHAVLAADFPCHLFLVLYIADAGLDCVMIHSSNPYSDFPCGDLRLSERVPVLEELLGGFVPDYGWRVYRSHDTYIAFSPDVGVPLIPVS